jgi:hypothetical protein
MKKCILILISVFTLSVQTKAQDGFEGILIAEGSDVNKLMEGYFAPAMEGFIYGMNNGWAHTAKVHKKLGFDLTIGLSASAIPSKREIFSLAGLSSISGASSAPTFAGANTETNLTVTRELTIQDSSSPAFGQQQTVTAGLTMPGGIKDDLILNSIPAPIVQLNVGLPWKLEGMLRLLPKTDIGDDGGQINMLGLGLKKEITDWFGPMEKTPLHVSVLAAFTKMNVTYGIEDVNSGDLIINNAGAEFDLNAFTVQAIASWNFPIINVYGGLGFNSGSSSLNMNGNYQGNYNYSVNGQQYTETINLSTPDLSFNASGLSTTVGARLSLGFFKIFGSYTLQEYNTLNAGIAFSLR